MKRFCALVLAAAAASSGAADFETVFLPGGRTIALPAFRVYMAAGYEPAASNLDLLKALREKSPVLALVEFDTAANNKAMLLCRASYPVYGPNKTPFAALVEAAINIELASSGPTRNEGARVRATLDEFDFSSFGSGKWTIQATFTAEGKPPLSVKHEHPFPVSAIAPKGCGEVMAALPAGVQSFLAKLYAEPRFAELSH